MTGIGPENQILVALRVDDLFPIVGLDVVDAAESGDLVQVDADVVIDVIDERIEAAVSPGKGPAAGRKRGD